MISQISVLLALLSGLSVPAPDIQASRSKDLQCTIAWAYIADLLTEGGEKRIVFDTDPVFVGEPHPSGSGSWWTKASGKFIDVEAPPSQLINSFYKQGSHNAVQRCSSIQRKLHARHIPFGRAATNWASQTGSRFLNKATIESVSVPSISADGRQAVLAASGVSGPLAGGAFLVHLVRGARGNWHVAGQTGLWVA